MIDQPKRECGGCTLCCKLLEVKEISKLQGKWCSHCALGRGCKIYDDRPKACDDFNCLWLQGFGTDDMRPDKSKVVMTVTTDSKNLVLHVDPSRPDAFREAGFERVTKNLLADGRKIFVVRGDQRLMIEEVSK